MHIYNNLKHTLTATQFSGLEFLSEKILTKIHVHQWRFKNNTDSTPPRKINNQPNRKTKQNKSDWTTKNKTKPDCNSSRLRILRCFFSLEQILEITLKVRVACNSSSKIDQWKPDTFRPFNIRVLYSVF